jgi:hypothetical protein
MCSPIILKIRALLLSLKIRSFSISFLWAPEHIGINGNKYVDSLAGSTANQSYSGPLWCPYTDLVTIHRTFINELWKLEWDSLSESYAFDYTSLFKNIPNQSWFQSLKMNRAAIAKFTRLRTGHSLPHHSFKLGLNSSACCPLPNCGGEYCDFYHLLINCQSLSIQRSQLKILFFTSGIHFSLIDALSTDNANIIKHTLNFILQSGLRI